MNFPVLELYLGRLSDAPDARARLRVDADGRAQGRYFNASLTSAFQPIRTLDTEQIVGFEGFARSYSVTDQGLSLWRLLDHAANDDESVELDRLCRLLHTINFYRQSEIASGDLYLSVHARLLAAIDGNHGIVFRRLLETLGLPQQGIVLQLPQSTPNQNWLLNYVADNYRRNGFRLAVNAADAREALTLLDLVRPDVIKLDARDVADDALARRLLLDAGRRGVRVIFKRVDHSSMRVTLAQLGNATGQAIHAQGFLWDLPQAALATSSAPVNVGEMASVKTRRG